MQTILIKQTTCLKLEQKHGTGLYFTKPPFTFLVIR